MNTVSLQENAVLKESRTGFWRRLMTGRDEQVFLILTLVIGAVVGLIVVAFILLAERFGARLYPAGGAAWRRAKRAHGMEFDGAAVGAEARFGRRELCFRECRGHLCSEPVFGCNAGRAYGTAGHAFSPNHMVSSGAYAPVGMGAAFALPSAESRLLEGNRHVLKAMRAGRGQATTTLRGAEGVIGVISREAIESATKNGDGEKRLREIVPPGEFPHVHADHSLHRALDRMGAAGLDVLPVVSRANVHQLLGIVTVDAVYGVRLR